MSPSIALFVRIYCRGEFVRVVHYANRWWCEGCGFTHDWVVW